MLILVVVSELVQDASVDLLHPGGVIREIIVELNLMTSLIPHPAGQINKLLAINWGNRQIFGITPNHPQGVN